MSHRSRRESRPDRARVTWYRSGETGAAWQRQRVRDTSLDDRNARRAQVDQPRVHRLHSTDSVRTVLGCEYDS